MTRPAIGAPHPSPRTLAAPAFALGMVASWVLFAAALNSGQPGDNFEQFTWAHSAEWGYHKHPPLPTWGLHLLLQVAGPWPGSTYVLSALCVAGTGALTWLIARRLLGNEIGAQAIVLWGLHRAYSSRAQLYNHNTVLMLCIAACAFGVLQAGQRRGGAALRWWLVAGLAAGGSLLAKYQAVIPLSGILFAVVASGQWRRPGTRAGLAVAAATALALFAPHLRWLVQHDFITLGYATSSAVGLGPLERVGRVLSFLVLQLRMLAPTLACLGLALWWQHRASAAAGPAIEPPALLRRPADEPDATLRRAWLVGMVVWPLGLVLLVCLIGGVRLQDHWGFQSLQFVALWLAWRLRARLRGATARLLVLALLVHAVAMAVYARPVWAPDQAAGRLREREQFYPAAKLGRSVLGDWQAVTSCPLRYVVGPTLEAGMVAVYGAPGAQVFEAGNPRLSPWIDPADVARAGAVYIGAKPLGTVPGAVREGRFELPTTPGGIPADDAYWAIVPPAAGCAPPPVSAQAGS